MLPDGFVKRMQKELPETEWESFFKTFEEKPVKSVRVNTLKIGAKQFESISPFSLEKIEWSENGYYTDEDKLGLHPYYEAGLYYPQEASAQLPVSKMEISGDEKILDLCSAPGGKGTQIASKMQGRGLLVLNEPVFQRAKILSENVERAGVKNAVVLCENPEKLEKIFPSYFDKILVDAPCSGEGMFKTNREQEEREWSEENVSMCAERQKKILSSAEKMLKKGGTLYYSTCTFSRAEDEEQTENFLKTYPYFIKKDEIKLYPHRVKGEGHYFTSLEKTDGEERSQKPFLIKISSQSEKIYRAFEKECLNVQYKNLFEKNSVLYALPDGVFDFTSLNVLRVGVRLGEIKKGRFEPSHSLCMASKKGDWKQSVDLDFSDPLLKKYLRGESIEGEAKGWCVVSVNGYPVGLAKGVDKVLKNHFPKAFRI